MELVSRDVIVNGSSSKVFSLRDLLDEMEDNVPWDVRFKATSDIVNGMEFIHSKSLVHGDLMSSNVLVGGDFNQGWIFKVKFR